MFPAVFAVLSMAIALPAGAGESRPADTVVGRPAARARRGRGDGARGPGRTPRTSAPLRVLVADDNPVNQRLLTALPERQGHSVVLADDGRQAAVLSVRERVDLVLMDLQMPELDGEAATRAIRAGERGRWDGARGRAA